MALAGRAYLPELAQSGVRFFRYERGFLHQKVMLIDDDLATVGTANLDNRSMRLNFEHTMVLADHALASEVEAMLESDFDNSSEIKAESLQQDPWWKNAAARGARLLAPVQQRAGSAPQLQPAPVAEGWRRDAHRSPAVLSFCTQPTATARTTTDPGPFGLRAGLGFPSQQVGNNPTFILLDQINRPDPVRVFHLHGDLRHQLRQEVVTLQQQRSIRLQVIFDHRLESR